MSHQTVIVHVMYAVIKQALSKPVKCTLRLDLCNNPNTLTLKAWSGRPVLARWTHGCIRLYKIMRSPVDT